MRVTVGGLVGDIQSAQLSSWILEQSAGADRYLFGIVGPPGSGKSTLAASLGGELGAPVVPMDGFHLTNAELVERDLLHLKGAPETFAASAFVDLVRALRRPTGVVLCPTFDRATEEPVPDQVRVVPSDPVVIVEGNYLLLEEVPWNELAVLFDAVAYLDVSNDVRVDRLVARHVEFGRGRSEALDFVRRSDEVNARRVEPARARADLYVSSVDQSR